MTTSTLDARSLAILALITEELNGTSPMAVASELDAIEERIDALIMKTARLLTKPSLEAVASFTT